MKKSMRPISSPGRTEKFPPPLMRFLRSNVGSKSNRSGRRSRASPMFIKKKNTVIEATQEPSSPKVTCIGQVRVRRSKKTKPTTAKTTVRRPTNRLCTCLRKLRPRSCITVFRKWVSFFRCGYCKKSKNLHESPPVTPRKNRRKVAGAGENEKEEWRWYFRCGYCKKSKSLHDSPPVTPKSDHRSLAGENGEEEVTVEGDNQGLISRTPPKNAFLLTRCRSAPYRSSSLASKFWESAAEKTEEEVEEVAEKIENLKIKEVNANENESKCEERNGVEELKAIKVAPLILTRCKSEPARTWDQFLA